MVLAGWISAALGIGVPMAGLFRAPAVAGVDRRLGQLAGARK
jgi:hypothetical protein